MEMSDDKYTVNTKFIATLIAIIAFFVGAAVWATQEHSTIKDWASNRDEFHQGQIKETIEDQYVPLSRFVKLEAQIGQQIIINRQILRLLEDIKRGIDDDKKDRRDDM